MSVAAIHMSSIPAIDYDTQLFGERTIRSTTASTRRDGEELLELAGEGVIHTRVEALPFEDLNEGLRRVAHSEIQGSAVLTVR